MRIRLAWSALAVVAAVTAAWFRTSRRCQPSPDPDRRHTVHDEGGGLANDQIDPAGDDPSSGPDEPQRGLEPLTQEDLSVWKFVTGGWNDIGLVTALVISLIAVWLVGEQDELLLNLIKLLVGPCAVLISVSTIAITFTGDWEMTSIQAKQREDLFFYSYMLIFITVLAIALAGVYTAMAPVSYSLALLANTVQLSGALASSLLALSLFGVIRQVKRMVELVRNQRPNPEDVLLADEHQNSHNDARV